MTPFPIGFRRTPSTWQGDLSSLLQWAKQNHFAHLDLVNGSVDDVRQIQQAGLDIGTIDLLRWRDLLSPDLAKRKRAVDDNIAHVKTFAAIGVTRFLIVLAPEDPARERRENFGYAVESLKAICRATEDTQAKIVVEGAPGKPPHFATLACTPADFRALLTEVDSPALGLNFDPSHPVRMGIDPLRILREFASRVYHVHAKDTIIDNDDLYEHGHLQQATFAEPKRFGAYAWRFAMPGKGMLPWREMFRILRDAGYEGRVSIEVEDADVSTDADEQSALVAAKEFLDELINVK